MLVGTLLSACSERIENEANTDANTNANTNANIEVNKAHNMTQETPIKDDLGESQMQETEKQNSELVTLKGQILFQDIEGGFFAFIAEDGKKYTPKGMPKEHLRDGLVIEMTGQVLPEIMTITQFGEVIKVDTVIVLDDSNALNADHKSTNPQSL